MRFSPVLGWLLTTPLVLLLLGLAALVAGTRSARRDTKLEAARLLARLGKPEGASTLTGPGSPVVTDGRVMRNDGSLMSRPRPRVAVISAKVRSHATPKSSVWCACVGQCSCRSGSTSRCATTADGESRTRRGARPPSVSAWFTAAARSRS